MVSKQIAVTQIVEVSVDESKFTPDFLAEFREHFYQFQSIDEHLKHLAQLHARGLCDDDSFIEGYGPAIDFGIKVKVFHGETEIDFVL
jgi:hypothetical protein